MAKKKSKKKLIIFLAILVFVVIAFVLIFLSGKGTSAIEVTTSKVEKRTITQTVSAVGKIEPETEVKISSETSGEISFLGIKEGESIKAGRLLVRINPDIIESQLAQFEAATDAAKTEISIRQTEVNRLSKEFTRVSDLFKKQFVSQDEYDKAKAALEQAEGSLQASKSQLEQARAVLQQYKRSFARTTISSPIDGVVTKLDVEKGEKVVGTAQMAGTEMMRISDLSVINAVVEVDENDIVLVKLGDTATIEIDAFPDSVFKGVVFEIGHSAIVSSAGTQEEVTNFQVKIRLLDKEQRLRPGMSCNVEIQTETHQNVLSVPLQSVTVRAGAEGLVKTDVQEDFGKKKDSDEKNQKIKKPSSIVFVKKGDTVKMKKVKTGLSDKGFIEITEGLKEGEEIISGSYLAISKLLQDGSKIKIDSTNKFKFGKK